MREHAAAPGFVRVAPGQSSSRRLADAAVAAWAARHHEHGDDSTCDQRLAGTQTRAWPPRDETQEGGKEVTAAPRPILLLAAAVVAFVSCTSTDPKAAFDDVTRHVVSRTGQEVRWIRDEVARDEIEKSVEA